jgi:hypothetical protein
MPRHRSGYVTRILSDSCHLLGLWQVLLRRGKQNLVPEHYPAVGNWIGPKVAYTAGAKPPDVLEWGPEP